MKTPVSQTQMLTMFQMIIDNLTNNSQINLMLKMRKKKNIIRNLNNLMSIHSKRKKLLSLILVWKNIKIKILRNHQLIMNKNTVSNRLIKNKLTLMPINKNKKKLIQMKSFCNKSLNNQLKNKLNSLNNTKLTKLFMKNYKSMIKLMTLKPETLNSDHR